MIVKRIFLLFYVFLLVFPLPAAAKTLYGQVLKVFDGDTILIRIQGRAEYVRLREIDAPEVAYPDKPGQEPWGRRAKMFAESQVQGKTLRLLIDERDERDKYHRLLAYVFLDPAFMNREMILSGNAFFYPGPMKGKYAVDLQKAEEAAQKKGLGVWDKRNGLKERPLEFRRRIQGDENLFSKVRGLIRVKGKKNPFKEYPLTPEKIIANKNSMIYHLPGSQVGGRVSPKNRVLFDTPEEAEKAGFRRARTR